MQQERVIAFAPASVGNFGPFFDVMGFCLDHLGDYVEAKLTRDHNDVRLTEVIGPYAHELKNLNGNNCAFIVAKWLWEHYDRLVFGEKGLGIDLVLHKSMPTETGLGSSAASCVAAAKAVIELMGIKIGESEIIEALLTGERDSTSHSYGDNVVPSFFGGVCLVEDDDRIELPCPPLFVTAILPDGKKMETGKQREVVGSFVDDLTKTPNRDDRIKDILGYIRFQSLNAGRLVNALHGDDIETVQHVVSLNQHNLLNDARTKDLSYFSEIRKTFIENGCGGCAISGSGPALFGISSDISQARQVKEKLLEKFPGAAWLVSNISKEGAVIVNSIEEHMEKHAEFHSFWST